VTNTVLWALVDFINQPDISLYFRNLTSVPRPEILEHLNSGSQAQFMIKHLGAFLFDRNHRSQCFKVHGSFGGRVTSIKEGWEFADEYSFQPGTIQRRINYIVPQPAIQFGRKLRERRHRLPLIGPNRDIAEVDLFHALRDDGYNVDLDVLKSFLNYLTLSGIMFQ
jgi:hypothetical protein